MIDLLVVSAFAPELVPLALPFETVTTLGHLSVVAAPAGIGPLAAAAGTASLLARFAPRRVVFVGTAGTFGAGELLEIVTAHSTELVDAALMSGWAQRPVPGASALDASFTAPLGLRAARVATTTSITVDAAWAERLAAAGFDVENLEVAGVLAAASAVGAPCSGLLAVTNRVGPRGRAEWTEHKDAAAARLAETLRALVAVTPAP